MLAHFRLTWRLYSTTQNHGRNYQAEKCRKNLSYQDHHPPFAHNVLLRVNIARNGLRTYTGVASKVSHVVRLLPSAARLAAITGSYRGERGHDGRTALSESALWTSSPRVRTLATRALPAHEPGDCRQPGRGRFRSMAIVGHFPHETFAVAYERKSSTITNSGNVWREVLAWRRFAWTFSR